jgi:hypothetical protein
MRLRLFEFEDLSWFPNSIREGGTDYLRYFLNAVDFYGPVIPLVRGTLDKLGERKVLDLCSGGGGAIEQIGKGLNKGASKVISITLSDKFPNVPAFTHISRRSSGTIDLKDFPIDAAHVPKEIPGFRTMFSAAHHFPPETIRSVLKDAVDNHRGIGLFDGGDKSVFTILGIMLFHPIAFLVCTPFFRPFRISRLVFTYVLPLIPLTTVWDGCVSILRLYGPGELLELTKGIGDNTYTWEAGRLRNKLGMRITYLIGHPAAADPTGP